MIDVPDEYLQRMKRKSEEVTFPNPEPDVIEENRTEYEKEMYDPDRTIVRTPNPERCPTCQGRFWSVRSGKWINTRETVDMICQTCGRDYMKEE